MEKLNIRRFSLQNGQVAMDADNSFSAMINPASVTLKQQIKYDTAKALGQVGVDAKFNAMGFDEISVVLVLDGTGVVPPATPGTATADVMTQLQTLRTVVYAYAGKNHEPSRVRLLWGTLIFFGRLTSLTTEYTLFKPSGDPLRAKVSLGFLGSMSKEAMALVSNRSSPDLNHRVVVREGDSLPLLCHAIYGDPAYYADVARHNGLAQFRQLAPGTVLDFPPLQ